MTWFILWWLKITVINEGVMGDRGDQGDQGLPAIIGPGIDYFPNFAPPGDNGKMGERGPKGFKGEFGLKGLKVCTTGKVLSYNK